MQMDGDQSSNIEDRRSEGGGFGGGGFPIPMGGGGGGLFKGGFGLVAFVVIAMIMGADPGAILSDIAGGGGGTSSYTPAPPAPSAGRTPGASGPASDAQTQFVSRVLKSTEDVWHEIFKDMGRPYRDPKLVLFRDATRTECGVGQAAMGPFYCPADQRVYLDLGFFDELARRFRVPGQFPQAYVIAHEVGHHVQNLLGISGKVQQMRQSMSKRDGNALSVRTELQADCFAGVWGHHANQKNLLQAGDVEEGLRAAAAIGDDMMQKRAQGRVSPESWTHGSSEQRVTWLRRGLTEGTIDACDTFGQASRR